MRNRWLCLILSLALAGVFYPVAFAQDQGSARGNLSGLVYDSTKAVVPGAQVTITGPIGSLTQTTTETGTFLFQTLIPGIYNIRVQKAGFRVADIKNAEVQINKTTSVEVILQAGEVTQIVEVNAAELTLDTTNSSVNTNISESLYQNLPVGRSMGSLFYLSPGAVDGQGTGYNNPSISGSTGLENNYVADGVSINDPAFGGLGVFSRVHGALGSGINLSFVQEVQVKTGGFEPQYGHAAGGVVQIVTKSGGTSTHGVVGGYYGGKWMQTNFANADDFNLVNQFGKWLSISHYEGDFQLGGYVPLGKLRDKVFYFGTFNPTWVNNYDSPGSNSGLFPLLKGKALLKQTSWDYAGKLTYKISSSHTLESSVFGDPSHTNIGPWGTLTANDLTTNSKWNFGTRNWAARYDGAFGPSWLVDGAFTWNWNHFTETPQFDVVQIVNSTQIQGLTGQRGQFTAQGFGFNEPYDSNTKGIAVDTSKTVHFWRMAHTFSFGYTWQNPIYDDIITESGGKFPLPATNASGTSPGYGSNVAGKMSDAAMSLVLAGTVAPGPNFSPDPTKGNPDDTTCTLCPYMVVPGYVSPVRVLLDQNRGRFDGGVTRSSGKYHAAYVNDAWAFGKYATLNVGVRWEQQRLVGNLSNKLFNDMWSPRVGFSVDPRGSRKTKIYTNFGRYHLILPLDAAVRELSNEEDVLAAYWAPASTTTGCPTGTPAGASCVVTNSDGTPNYSAFFSPDSSHLLNGIPNGGVGSAVTLGISGGEPYQPGLRAEYTDEWVAGVEHQFSRSGIVVSARYIDRRMKRVLEDEGGISVEQFLALANNGGSLNYFIGNPNGKSDIFVNPNEVTFGLGQAVATDGSALPAACIDSNGNPTPYVAYNVLSPTFPQTTVGSACFPAVNTNTWTTSTGALLPDCTSLAQSKQPGACAAFGGEFYSDGKPDGYSNVMRKYQAVEFEVNKSLSHGWALVANYRIARLMGNYEGAFRNDNGQADPGISSLYDLTPGAFDLIGKQASIGPLNTDRKHVVNIYSTYVLDRSRMKGLTLGSGVHIQSGVPLTTLYAQQAYFNPGEVPWLGRGDLGRAPTTGTVDLHAEYPWRLSEKMRLKFGFDAFNVANTKRATLIDEFHDLGFGIDNKDFKKPGGMLTFTPGPVQGHSFVPPFSSRFSLRLVF